MDVKSLKLEEQEDRISNLPDHIIHRILCFLPSTKEAIQTGILSKRWQNQWTQVPVLIFNYTNSGMSFENFLKFVDNTLFLHEGSKIEKFHLHYPCKDERDSQFAEKIRFSIRKHVEELTLSSINQEYVLPKFLFNNASLVKLATNRCTFMHGKVNWGCLTALQIRFCNLPNQAIEHILSGSPLLKSLELTSCYELVTLLIASKSLKTLLIRDLHISVIEISCLNLEQLSLSNMAINDSKLIAQAIENVVSGSSFLESIELIYCGVPDQLVIASKSLKRLVLRELRSSFDIEISCPKLENLMLLDRLNIRTAKLLNLPSSLCATIDFHMGNMISTDEIHKDILQQLQHIKELKIKSLYIKSLQIPST